MCNDADYILLGFWIQKNNLVHNFNLHTNDVQ